MGKKETRDVLIVVGLLLFFSRYARKISYGADVKLEITEPGFTQFSIPTVGPCPTLRLLGGEPYRRREIIFDPPLSSGAYNRAEKGAISLEREYFSL